MSVSLLQLDLNSRERCPVALFQSPALPFFLKQHQRTNGPVIAHLMSWPSKAQNIQNLENIW